MKNRYVLPTAIAMMMQLSVAQEICISDNNIFTVKVDLFASELGYYTFEECGNMTNPTLGMEIGQSYTFIQADRSNFYHPLGFAYYPDGAHDDVNELEPGISEGTTSCVDTLSCPAPMYFLDGEYFGDYSNIQDVIPETKMEDNFGLDDYEPLFFHPIGDWVGYGEFSVMLNFHDTTYNGDIFYFCHIHQFMSGRIKLLDNGVPISAEDTPPLGYDYEVPGPFDASCGTYGLDNFQLPHPECPNKFVCSNISTTTMQPFNDCIDAMNCHMLTGMTTHASSNSDKALFIHQMIPHHQNAVNMAKALLHTKNLFCPDLTDDENTDCALEIILREIINGQNFQIQAMRGILTTMGWPQTDDCEVLVPNALISE